MATVWWGGPRDHYAVAVRFAASNLRRIAVDVDKAIGPPDVLEPTAIERVDGVEGVNLTVTEIDL